MRNFKIHQQLASLIPLVLAGCASLGMESPVSKFEQSRVYYPTKYPDGNYHPSGLNYEDAHFAAADGTRLHGWFVPHENPRAVALFAHGNAGNVSHRAATLKILHDRHQVAVLAFDYRGYGHSEGKPSEEGLFQDARAARAWLAKRTGVAEADILLMGRSLGGAVVVDLASADGARGLVLASTFSTLPKVAKHHMPLLPTKLLMKNRFDSESKIRNYHGPLLQSHGDADRVVPYKLGKRLHAVAPGPKQFVTIPGGDHNDPQTEEYRRAFDQFLDSL